jgi:hypothetical protein
MLKKMLLATAAASILALGAASTASAHDRDWDGGKHWKKYSYGDDYDYRYFKKPHRKHYGYWKPYPWWLQYYYWQPRWY